MYFCKGTYVPDEAGYQEEECWVHVTLALPAVLRVVRGADEMFWNLPKEVEKVHAVCGFVEVQGEEYTPPLLQGTVVRVEDAKAKAVLSQAILSWKTLPLCVDLSRYGDVTIYAEGLYGTVELDALEQFIASATHLL